MLVLKTASKAVTIHHGNEHLQTFKSTNQILCTGTRGNYVQLGARSLSRRNPASAHASQHAKTQRLLIYVFIYLQVGVQLLKLYI